MIEIPIKVKSDNKELRSIIFGNRDEISFSEEASLIYDITDAEFGGFESELVIEMTAPVSSTEAVEPIAQHLYDKLNSLDSVEVIIDGKKAEMDEDIIRRRLMSGYYKN